MVDRCDYYSDEDYEYAVQAEIEEYKEQLVKEELAYEEAFAEYCKEEYEKDRRLNEKEHLSVDDYLEL